MTPFRILFILAAPFLLAATHMDAFVLPVMSRTSNSLVTNGSPPVISGPFPNKHAPSLLYHENGPSVLTRQRRSVAYVQMCSLFGLGLPELALILVAAVFLVGPEKLGELVKESGKTAGELADELKNVPTEFQKGMEQGETEARSRKAKPMKPVDKDKE